MGKLREFLEFAVRIEENGEKFYRAAGRQAEREDVRALWEYLADEEIKHKQTFEELLASGLAAGDPPPDAAGEYFAFLRAHMDQAVFNAPELQAQLSQLKAPVAAIRFAIQRESDSILFYEEIRNFMPAAIAPQIRRILQEEINHYIRLTELGKKIAAP